MVYILWFLSVVLAAVGLVHFQVFTLGDFFSAAAIWWSGYLMSWVFEPYRHHI